MDSHRFVFILFGVLMAFACNESLTNCQTLPQETIDYIKKLLEMYGKGSYPVVITPPQPSPVVVSPRQPPPIVVSPPQPSPVVVSPLQPPPIVVSPLQPSPVVRTPPQPSLEGTELREGLFFLPNIIFWNPYETFPLFFTIEKRVCPLCSSTLTFSYWNYQNPRTLQDIDNIALLVSAVYRCEENKHRILAHDEAILSLIPTSDMIPFVLLSRTGFTRSLSNWCFDLVIHMNFYAIESVITHRRWESYLEKVTLLNHYEQALNKEKSNPNFWSMPISKTPSNNIISKIFLVKFFLTETKYIRQLQSITVGSVITFDHTFKVATNIGYLRQDGKWISQYNSLFLVMNQNGEILTWQLTNGTTFSEIEPLLINLKRRSLAPIKTVYIDDCCKLRKKICSALGMHVSVKLDLFHAVQRITKTFQKYSLLYKECVGELRQVFRKDGDVEKERKQETPASDNMLRKMDKFVEKWKNVKDCRNRAVFTATSMNAINSLKKHISSNCLSQIPAGAGTNRNERFHHHIKAMFNRSRIGILLAYALLSVVIHNYNNSKTIHGRLVYAPLLSKSQEDHTSSRCTPDPVGIAPKIRQDLSLDDSSVWEIDLSENVLDVTLISGIYVRCIQKYRIFEILKLCGLHQLKKHATTFASYCDNISNVQSGATSTQDVAIGSLQHKMNQYGLQICEVHGDGNCFFTAVASSILCSHKEKWVPVLNRLGLGVDVQRELSLNVLTVKLRECFVNELLGERRHKYEEFLILRELDYELEANKFLATSFYDSELGDAMPLGICSALGFTIIIFSRDCRMPVLYVTPENITSEATVFLIHRPVDEVNKIQGHYDYAVSITTTLTKEVITPSHQEIRQPVTTKSCRCGVNKKRSQESKSCTPTAIYATRCSCYKSCRACTPLCQCFQCSKLTLLDKNLQYNLGKKESEGNMNIKSLFQTVRDLP